MITSDKQKQKSINFTRTVNSIAVLTRNFLNSLTKLLDSIETLKVIQTSQTIRKSTILQDILNYNAAETEAPAATEADVPPSPEPTKHDESPKQEELEESKSEMSPPISPRTEKDTNTESRKEGCYTLDELIFKLIGSRGYDSTFLQTFISTYRSFTDPYTLFEKLKKR